MELRTLNMPAERLWQAFAREVPELLVATRRRPSSNLAASELQGEAGLPHPTGPAHRHEAGPAQRLTDPLEITPPPDRGGHRRGKVVRR